jgi:hypothetical protein
MRPAHSIRRKLAAAILAGLAALAAPGSARAAFVADSTVNIAGTPQTSGPGYFTGSIAVDNLSKTSADVRITLTNTSPVANGGYITGFAFNLPTPGVTSAGLTSAAPASFTQIGGGAPDTIGNYDAVAGSPYGYFDVGAAVGGDLLGGGSPVSGVAVNQTGTFTFRLSSNGSYNLNNLTASVLMSLLSANPQGGGAQPFLVRFRGFANGDSDKVIGGTTTTPPPPPPPPPGAVPAPPGVLLGLIGLGGCFLGRGFRRRTTAAVA